MHELLILAPAFGLLALTVFSCNEPDSANQAAANACPSNVAMVQVSDGYMEDLCGCQEGAGVIFLTQQPLTCTVSVGATVQFVVTGNQLSHQILPTGTSTFMPSPVFTPGADGAQVYPVTFSTGGGYGFTDAYDSALSGTIQVL
jgi:plastocyanin